MNILTKLTAITLLMTVGYISGFSSVTPLGNSTDDFTQREIVSIVTKFMFHSNTNLPSVDELLTDDALMEEFRILNWLEEPNTTNDNIRRAIDEVADQTILAGQEHLFVPEWTFSNERIHEGHTLLRSIRQELVKSLLDEQTDLRQCRKLLGQLFHLVFSFYSNTNWVEIYRDRPCTELGVQSTLPYRVAAQDEQVCTACSVDDGCQQTLLLSETLTSGYWIHKTFDTHAQTDDQTDTVAHARPGDDTVNVSNAQTNSIGRSDRKLVPGKCRHGGILDGSRLPNTIQGGINKMSGDPAISPHHQLHAKAVVLAIYHCIHIINSPEFGLTAMVGQERIKKLFGIPSDVIDIYVDTPDIPAVAAIFDGLLRFDWTIRHVTGMTLGQACAFSGENTLVILKIQDHVTTESLPEVCNKVTTRMFYIVPDSEKESRAKRAVRTTTPAMDLYNIIAQVSGGSVYHTTKADIGAVVDLIKETVSAKPPVSIMKFILTNSSSDTFTIPVDELVGNVTIKVQALTNRVPTFNLYWPNGTNERYTNHNVATKQILGRRLVVVKLINATAGMWRFKRTGSLEYEIEISAKTDLDFTFKFMQPGPGGYGEYPLIGRPIAGVNTSVQVTVPLYDQVQSVNSIVVLDDEGNTRDNATLQNIGGRHGKSLFKTYITVPSKGFKIAIEGKDKSNNLFRRLDPRLISTLAVKLEVLGVSGTLYVNATVNLTYRVTNVGGGSARVVVKISDDKGFSRAPVSHRHNLSSHQNITGTFVIEAGSTKGETVTVTVSANIEGAPANKVQYNVQRLTVEENITRAVDNYPPTCNVTKVTGTCDLGTDLCACVNKTWRMEAVLGDVGFGLQSLFVSGAGNKSVFDHVKFITGHTVDKGVISANLSADCCHQHATITAVDLAGNVGLCNVTLTPNFVAPDPKLCENPSKLNLNPSNQSNAIQCNTTLITDSCDFRNSSCTGDLCRHDVMCKNSTWKMRAVIGNHSYAIHQVIPVNVGKSAQLLRNNDSLELITDCCHTTAYINIIDIAGNIGQCYANTPVIWKQTVDSNITTSTSQGSGSLPIPIIAGAAGGGIVLITVAVVVACIVKKHMDDKVVPLT